MSDNPAEWAGFEAPEGYKLGWKVVRPDGRTHHDYVWPLTKATVTADNVQPRNKGACPEVFGDGLCIALGWDGAASGGITAVTGLALAYKEVDVLGAEASKLRVSACQVLGVLDLQRLIREGHAARANLSGANLSCANLARANLSCADLSGAKLSHANLSCANLSRADLYGASLYGADLSDAIGLNK